MIAIKSYGHILLLLLITPRDQTWGEGKGNSSQPFGCLDFGTQHKQIEKIKVMGLIISLVVWDEYLEEKNSESSQSLFSGFRER